MIEQSDKNHNYRLKKFWCHYCQQEFSCHLRPGIDDIVCPKCSNDFCEQITQTSKPQKFDPYQKPLRPKARRLPRYSAQAVLVALAQYSEQARIEKYREICQQDIRKLRIKVQKHLEECLICKQEIKIGTEALKCPCSHVYHVQCFSEWLQYKNTCPKCRAKVLSQQL